MVKLNDGVGSTPAMGRALAGCSRFDEFDQQEIGKHEERDFTAAKGHGWLGWRNDDGALGA
jgi:hypothetical protein